MRIIHTNPVLDGCEVHIDEHRCRVDLFYPRSNKPDKVIIGLSDTRAADDIRIHYDFTRDGWVVEQASVFAWEADDEVMDPDWKEVAFIQAWGRERNASNAE